MRPKEETRGLNPAGLEEVIAIAGDKLRFFYAWQHQDGVKQLPGEGTTDFTPWLSALARIHYRWYVNPFMHGAEPVDVMTAALAGSRRYLTKCFGAM